MYHSKFFDADQLLAFMRSLPQGNATEDLVYQPTEKIALMTHDDTFDWAIHSYELAHGYPATWFILPNHLQDADTDADLQLHYVMENGGWVGEQIKWFEDVVGRKPIANRNHRIFWRANHLDLANLAMHGIQLDSTHGGRFPSRLCVDGIHLPIWSVPYQIVDYPYVNSRTMAVPTFNRAPMRTLFESGMTPLVGIFHPQHIRDSDYTLFFQLAVDNGYTLLNFTQLAEKLWKSVEPVTS